MFHGTAVHSTCSARRSHAPCFFTPTRRGSNVKFSRAATRWHVDDFEHLLAADRGSAGRARRLGEASTESRTPAWQFVACMEPRIDPLKIVGGNPATRRSPPPGARVDPAALEALV